MGFIPILIRGDWRSIRDTNLCFCVQISFPFSFGSDEFAVSGRSRSLSTNQTAFINQTCPLMGSKADIRVRAAWLTCFRTGFDRIFVALNRMFLLALVILARAWRRFKMSLKLYWVFCDAPDSYTYAHMLNSVHLVPKMLVSFWVVTIGCFLGWVLAYRGLKHQVSVLSGNPYS